MTAQGPEHSSARLERFLQLCAEDNMQVANCTTPANYFHILRRQMKRDFRKPLILMTPKNAAAPQARGLDARRDVRGSSSSIRLLCDDAQLLPTGASSSSRIPSIRRSRACARARSTTTCYEEREKRNVNDIYLLRVEQLYPFPLKALITELPRFKQRREWCGARRNPSNMGAWSFIDPYLEWVLAHIDAKHQRVRYTGRPAAASPATGLMSKHLAQLAALLEDALGE
jgi:2-oxoglutarate dehydrogenase E1 component